MPLVPILISSIAVFQLGVDGRRNHGTQPCVTVADCADFDADSIRDDHCMWWDCVDGACQSTEVIFGDTSGQFLACPPDGVTDGNDFGLGLYNCFAAATDCEDEPPLAMHFDIGSRYGLCQPDGVCDLNDSWLGERTFGDEQPCSCPLDGGPNPLPDSRQARGSGAARLFMAPPGQQHDVATTGNTTIVAAPGDTVTLNLWLQDSRQPPPPLSSYQILIEVDAQPLRGAVGSVSYVDNNAGMGGGDSFFLDTAHDAWPFAGAPGVDFPVYTEPLNDGFSGFFYKHILHLQVDVAPDDIHYLGQFDIRASEDAAGQFELMIARDAIPGSPRPLTDLFSGAGQDYGLDEVQNITVVVGGCRTFADCADTDFDGIRDDACVWWACNGGLCEATDIVRADMGGQFGSCVVDGTADGNDRFHALNCFSNSNADGSVPYDCEPAAPAAFNVDAGGRFGSCLPDGVCDGNDAFIAINAFSKTTTCVCPSGP